MGTRPTIIETLLGTEGLALLRLANTGDAAARRARVAEIGTLLVAHTSHGPDPEGDAPGAATEYDLKRGYELWAETYDERLRLFPIEEPEMHGLFDSLPSASDILDAACGTGRHSAYLAARGHRVVGVDRSAAMLTKARPKLPDVTFEEGDLEALPVADAQFDAAVCALALVHLPELGTAARELARALRPGGRLIVSDVHPFPILLGWQAQFRTARGETGFMRIHPHLPSDYIQAFSAAGLRVRGCTEPRLTAEAAATPAAGPLPEANHAAWVGLPGVIVWDLEKV